jgi:hypothetical protein
MDWLDPKEHISKWFTVKEALWLPSFECLHIPSEQEKQDILIQAGRMDLIRDYIGKPINVHVWIRPIVTNCPGNPNDQKNYNALVGGAENSMHIYGKATDWDCGEDCDITRFNLRPVLEQFNIRMEFGTTTWIHTDCKEVAPYMKRYFIP